MNIMRTLTINGTTYNVTPVVPASSVTLLAAAWTGNGDAYAQVVELPGVTANTKVDLQPTPEQLEEFHYLTLAFVAENENGVVTVYAIGDKPTSDHTIQTTLTEVEASGKIRGNTVGTTMPRPDWDQTDSTKADYIMNKPVVVKSVNGITPDKNGNVEVAGSGGGTAQIIDGTLVVTGGGASGGNGNNDALTKLPNALTFTGAVEATYDGSEPVMVNIPSGGASEFRLLRSITLAEDTKYIQESLGANYNEVRIAFRNLWCVEGTACGVAVSANDGVTTYLAQCAVIGMFVNSSNYPCSGVAEIEKVGDDCLRCSVVGMNTAGNSKGSGIGPIMVGATNGIERITFSLEGYNTHTMNTGAIIDIYGR